MAITIQLAEIVTLRNMAKAYRDHKESLDKPIECDKTVSLSKSVESLSNRTGFAEVATYGKDYIQKGHGGKMVDKMREAIKKGKVKNDDEITDTYLNLNRNIDWDEVKYRSDVASESENFTAEKTSRMSLEDMKNGLLKMTQLNTKDLNFNMNSAYPKRENVVEHVHEVNNNNPDLNIV